MKDVVLERGPELRRIILMSLVIGVPTLFLRVTQDPFNVPKLAWLGVGVALASGLRGIEVLQGSPWRLPRLWVPASLLAAPILVAWVLSPYRGWAAFGLHGRLLGALPYILAIIFGLLVADSFRGEAGRLAFGMAWSGALVGGYALVQTFGLDPFEWSLLGAPTEAISTTGNPNFTGGFLGIVLPLAIALVLSDPDRRQVTGRLLLPIVGGWLVSRSQGGWAAGLAGLVILAGYALRPRLRMAPAAAWVISALIAVVTVGAVAIAMVKPDGRLATESGLVRSRWWAAAIGMGTASPLVGRGPNSFSIEGVSYRPTADALAFNFDFAEDPHSVPLSMFANLGLPGLLGFLGILGWAIRFFTRLEEPSLLATSFVGAIVAYFIQSAVSIDQIGLRAALWVALAGLVCSAAAPDPVKGALQSKNRAKKPSRRKPQPLRSPLAAGGVAVVTLAFAAWSITWLVADAGVANTLRTAGGDPQRLIEGFERPLALRNAADYRALLAFRLRDSASAEDAAVDPDVVAATNEAFSFTEEVPYVFSVVSWARFLQQQARSDPAVSSEAAALLEKALEIDPKNPIILAETAVALGDVGRSEEGLKLLEPYRNLVGDRYPEFWGALALTAARLGDFDLAEQSVEVALRLSAEEPNAKRAQRILERATPS